jgi:hypothetical protein
MGNSVRKTIHGRPHQRTIEAESFSRYINHLAENGAIDQLQEIWLDYEFRAELDRQRALEKRYRISFWMLQTVALGSAVLLPPLITASESINWLRNVAIAVSFVVAGTTVISQVFRPGPRWRIYRYTADELSREASCFFQKIAPYDGVDFGERLQLFQVRTEMLLREFSSQYMVDIDAIIAKDGSLDSGNTKVAGGDNIGAQ